MEIRVVDEPECCKFEVEQDENWTVSVFGNAKDQKNHIVYKMKAVPAWPKRFGVVNADYYITRRLADCQWLDKRLRVKYPFIYA